MKNVTLSYQSLRNTLKDHMRNSTLCFQCPLLNKLYSYFKEKKKDLIKNKGFSHMF